MIRGNVIIPAGELRRYIDVVVSYKLLSGCMHDSIGNMLDTLLDLVGPEIKCCYYDSLGGCKDSFYSHTALYNSTRFKECDLDKIERSRDGRKLTSMFKNHPYAYVFKHKTPCGGDMYAKQLLMGVYRCYGGSRLRGCVDTLIFELDGIAGGVSEHTISQRTRGSVGISPCFGGCST